MNIERIILIISILLRFSNFSLGQANNLEWAPIGATWTYFSPFFRGGGTPFTVTSLRDTLIEGRTCRYLANENRFLEIILYEENDTIYTYQNGQFGILYDFTAQPGDTVEIYMPSQCINETYKVRIDSVGNIQWGNSVYRIQYVFPIEGTCELGFGLSGTIVEKIGALQYLLPQSLLADPPISLGLLQYSDSTCHRIFLDSSRTECFPNGGFYNALCAYQATCDTTINVSTDGKIFDSQGIHVYPSPAQDHIILQSTAGKFLFGKVAMYDLTGKIVTFIKPNKVREAIIDVSHLNNGIYLLQVEIDQAWYTHKVQIQR